MSGNASPTADAPKSGFTQMPNSVLKATHISHSARFLYNILLSYCYHKDCCFPSYQTLMTDMQCSSQALSTYLTELRTNGLISITRRGQGKTNLYHLTDVVQPAPAAKVQPHEAEEASSLKIKEQEFWKSKTEEYRKEEYRYFSSNDEKYPSSTRKAVNSGHNYVNSHSSTDQHQDSTEAPHQPRVEQYKNERRTTARSIETIEPQNTRNLPPRENNHDKYEDITRGVLLEYMSDFAEELHDEAPLTSSTTRLYNLFRQSGLTIDAFTTCLYVARAVTKERTGSIRKYTQTGVKAKTGYFFAVLEDRLGIRRQGKTSLVSGSE